MKNFIGAIMSRVLLLCAAGNFVLVGNSFVLFGGCLIALVVELVPRFRQTRRTATRSVVAVISLLEMGLVAAILAIYFQSSREFWFVLATWVIACWMLPIWRRSANKSTEIHAHK
jgi:hypothetical protein